MGYGHLYQMYECLCQVYDRLYQVNVCLYLVYDHLYKCICVCMW